ncbi:transporter substrate-binding domain-containing protein [Vibrio metschnikovii]
MTVAFPAIAWADRDWSQQAVRMCVDPDWEPLEKITLMVGFVGIAADLLRVIFQRNQVGVRRNTNSGLERKLVKSQAGECDILALLNKTEQRSQWLNFTRPYLVNPNVLITRHEHHYVDNLNESRHDTDSILFCLSVPL